MEVADEDITDEESHEHNAGDSPPALMYAGLFILITTVIFGLGHPFVYAESLSEHLDGVMVVTAEDTLPGDDALTFGQLGGTDVSIGADGKGEDEDEDGGIEDDESTSKKEGSEDDEAKNGSNRDEGVERVGSDVSLDIKKDKGDDDEVAPDGDDVTSVGQVSTCTSYEPGCGLINSEASCADRCRCKWDIDECKAGCVMMDCGGTGGNKYTCIERCGCVFHDDKGECKRGAEYARFAEGAARAALGDDEGKGDDTRSEPGRGGVHEGKGRGEQDVVVEDEDVVPPEDYVGDDTEGGVDNVDGSSLLRALYLSHAQLKGEQVSWMGVGMEFAVFTLDDVQTDAGDRGQLHPCRPTALTVTLRKSLSPSIGKRVSVDLVTFTRFQHPATKGTEWYTHEVNEGSNRFECHPASVSSGGWTRVANMPTKPYMQPAVLDGGSEDKGRISNEGDAAREVASGSAVDDAKRQTEALYHGKDDPVTQPHRHNNAEGGELGSEDDERFISVPSGCAVLRRRLALVPRDAVDLSGWREPTAAKIFEAPFAPDWSSRLYQLVVRVEVRKGDCLPHIVSEDRPASPKCKPEFKAQRDGHVDLVLPVLKARELHSSWQSADNKCSTPDRSALPAYDRIGHRGPNPSDVCFPVLHVPFVPMAVHFGVYRSDGGVNGGLFAGGRALHGSIEEDRITAVAGTPQVVVIKPMDRAAEALSDAVRHVTFYGRLTKIDRIVNVDVALSWSDKLGGYAVNLDVREPGTYSLELFQGWVYGDDDERGGLEPVLVGTHMAHAYRYCAARRAMLWGAPWVVEVTAPADSAAPVQIWGDGRKCETADQPGRWVFNTAGSCAKFEGGKACTGEKGFKDSVGGMGWGGEVLPWLWVPYTCTYHIYSVEDITRCAKQANIGWFLIHGDSQVREMLGHLNLLAGYGDVYGKFAALERTPYVAGAFRLSYFWQEAMYLQNLDIKDVDGNKHPFSRGLYPYLAHHNVMPDCASGKPLREYVPHPKRDPNANEILTLYHTAETLNKAEEGRPDVFVWNPAMAYAAQDMSGHEFDVMLRDMQSYMWNGTALGEDAGFGRTNPPERLRTLGWIKDDRDDLAAAKNGCEGKAKGKMRFLYYAAPYIYSQAHPNSKWLTTHRVESFNRKAVNIIVREMGALHIDAHRILKSRWEESYDGLHYMRSTIEDPGHGLASAMVQQAALNAIFDDCGPT